MTSCIRYLLRAGGPQWRLTQREGAAGGPNRLNLGARRLVATPETAALKPAPKTRTPRTEALGAAFDAAPSSNTNALLFSDARVVVKAPTTQSVISSASSFQPVVVEQGADQLVAALRTAPPHTFGTGAKYAFKPIELDGATLTNDTENLAGALRKMVNDLSSQDCDVPQPKAGEGLWEYLHRSRQDIWSKDNYLVRPTLVLRNFEQYLNRYRSNNPRGTEIFDLGHNRIPARVTVARPEGIDMLGTPNVNVVFALDGPLSQRGARALEQLHVSRPELLQIH